jgi:hypothetical protein
MAFSMNSLERALADSQSNHIASEPEPGRRLAVIVA